MSESLHDLMDLKQFTAKPSIPARNKYQGPYADGNVKVGKKIDVGDVFSRSANILTGRPAIMLAQVIAVIPNLMGDILTNSFLNPLRIVFFIASFVLSVIVGGSYPSLVKATLEGGQMSIANALEKAYHRFWSLLAAGIIVGLIVLLGLVALIVPGIIFATWYAYTVPAIILEDKGATEGMSASKAFGRDKKGSTFLILLVLATVAVVLYGLQAGLSFISPLLGQIVYAVLSIPFGAWIGVIVSYTYLAYGPSSVTATTEIPGSVTSPPTPMQGPPVQGVASVGSPFSNRFCRSCGSPLRSDSRFCSNCGTAV